MPDTLHRSFWEINESILCIWSLLNPFGVLNLEEYPTLDIQAIEAGRALIIEEIPFKIRSEKDLPESHRSF